MEGQGAAVLGEGTAVRTGTGRSVQSAYQAAFVEAYERYSHRSPGRRRRARWYSANACTSATWEPSHGLAAMVVTLG